jgi:hypothetical protein
MLLKELKNVFVWIYKDLKSISLDLGSTQNQVRHFNSTNNQAKYRLNLNYATTVKHDIDKLLVVGFIQLVEEAT